MAYDYKMRTKRSDEKLLKDAESLTKRCQVLANWPQECYEKWGSWLVVIRERSENREVWGGSCLEVPKTS